jgi:hypothetical protein
MLTWQGVASTLASPGRLGTYLAQAELIQAVALSSPPVVLLPTSAAGITSVAGTPGFCRSRLSHHDAIIPLD